MRKVVSSILHVDKTFLISTIVDKKHFVSLGYCRQDILNFYYCRLEHTVKVPLPESTGHS